MHFPFILAVFATLTLAETTPRYPLPHSITRCALATVGMGVVVWLATVVSLATVRALRHDFSQSRQYLRGFQRWQQVHIGLWLCVIFGIEYGLQWPQLVRVNWRLDGMLLVDELCILAPLVVPLLLSWAVEFEVVRAICVGGKREAWKWQSNDRSEYVIVQARHYLGLVLLPVLLLLTVRDVVHWSSPELLAGRHAWLVYVTPIVVIVVAFPLLLRMVWMTDRLGKGPLRDRLEASARRYGMRMRDILVWRTHQGLVNAAVAGIFPQIRYVFLTDGLLARLDDDEIDAVLAHEAGHTRLHHLVLRVVVVLLPICVWQLAENAYVHLASRTGGWTGQLGHWADLASPALPAIASCGYLFLTLGWYSRLLEHQADLWACQNLQPSRPARDGLSSDRSALATYVRTLERLVPAQSANRRSRGWLHPSLQSRIDFLLRTAHDPRRASVFHGRVRLAGYLLMGVALVPLCLLMWIS